MDNTELHYLTYDPEEIWREMMYAYVEAGGDILYPGDEKEMLLRAVQAIIVQCFAGVDNALRMATLRYAVGEYLDMYGEKRNCYRIEAAAAEATVEIVFAATGKPKTIAAGTPLTADGTVMYLLAEDVIYSGFAQTVQVGIICSETGIAGNGLTAGKAMQFVNVEESVSSVKVKSAAVGGMEAEDDESYRTRIQQYGLGSVTTGPSGRYESESMKASSEIIDARALRTGAGEVGIYLILAKEASFDGIKASVLSAVNAENVRPLTDKVEVYEATKITYKLNVQYQAGNGGDVANAISEAVAEYQTWQESSIGRPFNPDKLMSALYQAGATRVVWGPESKFNGGDVQYTEIDSNAYCSGEITTAVMGA